MAIYKNTNSDWYISVDGGSGTIYLDGSLDITGNITYVSDLAVNDAFIIVAANNTGTVQDMGLIAQKSSTTFAGLRFDTLSNAWQISSSVDSSGGEIASYANILTGGGSAFVAGANTQVQFNDGGNFGATANLVFDKSTNRLTVSNGSTVLGNVGSAVAYAGNGVALYNNTTNSGGTGLYVVGGNTTNDELISLTRARLYSIIF
jgi:hypothetical protein